VKLDVVHGREFIARLRKMARRIPLLWKAYFLYWSCRRNLEKKSHYPAKFRLENFGRYPEPTLADPVIQLCTAEQMTGPLYDAWCRKMHSPPRFSRKQWEFVYILEVLSRAGCLAPGKRGLGFGCGREPLVGLFASQGCDILATDLDAAQANEKGWVDTGQHAGNQDLLFDRAREFCDREEFYRRVSFRNVDMNNIPKDLYGRYDFVWSACSFEHLGSLRHGMDFVREACRCLRPGGTAVHTTEFNLSSKTDTLETPSCSVYREGDIRKLAAELQAMGYELPGMNLNTGGNPVDRHIDVPPYGFSPHLKLQLERFIITSVGLIIKKPAV